MLFILILLIAALATCVWMAIRLKRQVRREQQLRTEAEASKHQIIIEQQRNSRRASQPETLAHDPLGAYTKGLRTRCGVILFFAHKFL